MSLMQTVIELPDDLFKKVQAKAAFEGQSIEGIVTQGLRLLLEGDGAILRNEKSDGREDSKRSPSKRASAGAWAAEFVGVAKLAPSESSDDVRMEHYREKYGI